MAASAPGQVGLGLPASGRQASLEFKGEKSASAPFPLGCQVAIFFSSDPHQPATETSDYCDNSSPGSLGVGAIAENCS